MAYIYQADVWCDSCGEHIKAELDREKKTPEDVDDESSFDSDEYPKQYDAENEEADDPQNCADGRCGGFSNGSSYGTFLQNQLTQEGYRYLKSMLDSHAPLSPSTRKNGRITTSLNTTPTNMNPPMSGSQASRVTSTYLPSLTNWTGTKFKMYLKKRWTRTTILSPRDGTRLRWKTIAQTPRNRACTWRGQE